MKSENGVNKPTLIFFSGVKDTKSELRDNGIYPKVTSVFDDDLTDKPMIS